MRAESICQVPAQHTIPSTSRSPCCRDKQASVPSAMEWASTEASSYWIWSVLLHHIDTARRFCIPRTAQPQPAYAAGRRRLFNAMRKKCRASSSFRKHLQEKLHYPYKSPAWPFRIARQEKTEAKQSHRLQVMYEECGFNPNSTSHCADPVQMTCAYM